MDVLNEFFAMRSSYLHLPNSTHKLLTSLFRMKFSVFNVLLIAIAAAQDPNTAGGQAGSVTNDPSAHTPPPVTAAPPMPNANAGPAGVNPPTNGAPSPPSFAAPATEAPWAGNPAPMTDSSGSGSFGSAGDIETPVTKRPKRVTDSSRSQSSTPTPSEDSGASIMVTTTGAWAIAGLGLAAML